MREVGIDAAAVVRVHAEVLGVGVVANLEHADSVVAASVGVAVGGVGVVFVGWVLAVPGRHLARRFHQRVKVHIRCRRHPCPTPFSLRRHLPAQLQSPLHGTCAECSGRALAKRSGTLVCMVPPIRWAPHK